MPMSSNTKRRAREAEKRVERLHFKFITEYVKCLHGDIYDKAEGLYNNTRQQYPDGVKDLTKTVEFMHAVTPNKAIPRYYTHRKGNETHTEKNNMQEMVLNIPLIPLSKTRSMSVVVSSPPAVSQPLPLSDEVYQELLNELQQDPDLLQILNDFPIDDMDVSSQQHDPDPLQILNDFPIDDMDVSSYNDMDDSLYNDIWDAIIPDDVTPLEKELQFH